MNTSTIAKGSMLAMLDRAMAALPDLLRAEQWESLLVDDEQPEVWRLWRPFESGRVFLHRILPCKEALFHPHPWPSACSVLHGSYEMAVGMDDHALSSGVLAFGGVVMQSGRAPTPSASLVLTKGSRYEMVDARAWHSVKPLETVLSVMVVGAPFAQPSRANRKPKKALGPLDRAQVGMVRWEFRTLLGCRAIDGPSGAAPEQAERPKGKGRGKGR